MRRTLQSCQVRPGLRVRQFIKNKLTKTYKNLNDLFCSYVGSFCKATKQAVWGFVSELYWNCKKLESVVDCTCAAADIRAHLTGLNKEFLWLPHEDFHHDHRLHRHLGPQGRIVGARYQQPIKTRRAKRQGPSDVESGGQQSGGAGHREDGSNETA